MNKSAYTSLLILFLCFTAADHLYGRSGLSGERQNRENPVNIVLFIADDLGAIDIGPYGNHVVRTPHIDRLADESLLFSEAFATSPTCSPSRASIHTGMMPFRNGAHANHTGIDEGIRTLPDYLQSLGYTVALAGKYHIGPGKAYPFELIHNTNIPEPGYEDQGVLWTDLNMGPVDRWLSEQDDDGPFMLVVNDHSPHVVWPEDTEYDPSTVNIPSKHIDTGDARKSRARYYSDITKMDRNMGKLLTSLEKQGFADNTVVIFTADQGPQWPFGKWSLYDYGMRVPLLVRWPGVIEEGSSSDALVSLVDLLPTVVELAGGAAPDPAEVDGRSFLPVLLDRENEHRERVFGSHTGDGNMNRSPARMLRTKRYKYILNLAPDIRYQTHMDRSKNHDGGREYWDSWVESSYRSQQAASVLWRYHNRPEEELYDLRADPDETVNLAGNPHYEELLGKFRSGMDSWREQQGDRETGPYQPPENRKSVTPYIFR